MVPIFQQQIREGGPNTVTHPEVTRYFMTIAEAAQLVFQTSVMGRGGEIFILDMGAPVRIVKLATNLILRQREIGPLDFCRESLPDYQPSGFLLVRDCESRSVRV